MIWAPQHQLSAVGQYSSAVILKVQATAKSNAPRPNREDAVAMRPQDWVHPT